MRGGKLTNLDVQLISLVKAGANRRTLIAKSALAAGKPIQLPILKVDEERRVIYCAVYAPNELDAHGDWSTVDEIRKASYGYMAMGRPASGAGVDVEHDLEPTANYVCESWIVEKELGKGFVNAEGDDEPDGTWVVGIHVTVDKDWGAIKKGKLNGVSMGALGTRELGEEPPTVEVAKSLLSDAVRRRSWESLGGALSDAVYAIVWDNTITDKEAAIREAIAELDGLVQKSVAKENTMNVGRMIAKALGFKGPEDVVASFTAEAEKITKSATPTEAVLQEEYGAHLKALEAFDKGAESKPALDAALTVAKAALPKPETTEQVAVLKAALAPLETAVKDLGTRLETLEKATPPSNRGDVRNEGGAQGGGFAA